MFTLDIRVKSVIVFNEEVIYYGGVCYTSLSEYRSDKRMY